jgi:hypothetical protein
MIANNYFYTLVYDMFNSTIGINTCGKKENSEKGIQ